MKLTKVFILTVLLISIGCTKTPEKIDKSSNPEVNVEQLFTYEGCIVYRFRDVGETHYYTRCGNVTDTINQHTETCGKNCYHTKKENIPTLELERP